MKYWVTKCVTRKRGEMEKKEIFALWMEGERRRGPTCLRKYVSFIFKQPKEATVIFSPNRGNRTLC